MKKITDTYLRRLAKGTGKRHEVYAGDGLVLRVSQTGKVSFWYRWHEAHQKKNHKIGDYPGTSLARAKSIHADLVEARQRGDVITKQTGIAGTVNALANEYILHHAKPKKKTWETDKRLLENNVLPTIGHLQVADIRRRHIVEILDAIYDRGAPRQSNVIKAILHKMFKVGLQRNFPGLEFNPVADVDNKPENKPNDRWLTEIEIAKFWNDLPKTNIHPLTMRCLQLVLVTGQRPGECLGIRQSEINGRWWTIPKERTKNGIEQRVWLTPLAMQLIGKEDQSFPVPEDIRVMSYAIRRAINPGRKRNRLEVEKFTPHDLRRTCATHMATIGIDERIIGQILNHKMHSITGIYNRYAYDKEKRAALIKWSARLRQIVRK